MVPSTKPLSKKLFIREDYRMLLLNAPEDYESRLEPLPKGVSIQTDPDNQYDLIQIFVGSRNEMEDKVPPLVDYLKDDGWLWISYPKGTSSIKTNINRDSIWKYAVSLGLKAVHQMSVDTTWSAIRFRKQ